MAWSICSRLGGVPAAFMPCSVCARVRALVKVRLSSPSSRAASRSASRRALSCAPSAHYRGCPGADQHGQDKDAGGNAHRQKSDTVAYRMSKEGHGWNRSRTFGIFLFLLWLANMTGTVARTRQRLVMMIARHPTRDVLWHAIRAKTQSGAQQISKRALLHMAWKFLPFSCHQPGKA